MRLAVCPNRRKLETPINAGDLLSRGPVHGAAAEDMQMQMVDGLATFRSRIHDNAKAFGEAFFRQLCGDQREMAQHFLVRFGGVGERVDVLFGDDEEVGGRLGMDVLKGDGILIFEDLFGGNFSGDNPAK